MQEKTFSSSFLKDTLHIFLVEATSEVLIDEHLSFLTKPTY